ncbi:MAG: UvrD-helicase domain-containing protein [Desulforegulaceae bacterium]|nr:UvrD-helicase domain-containing protein [Desulforegulaceae bacterium]
MKFLADLHIHSKYSMATAKNSDLETNYIYASKKGINVVGTGDFTHPAWFNELESKLLEDKSTGLFVLKKDIEKNLDDYVNKSFNQKIRFMLQCEISSIYKKNGKVRKIHNLVYFPSLESVKKFNSKLDSIGNIKSDGRPILGLDSRDLLEIILETDERGFLIPAHIWTPWFSLFGSKSGFDKIEECYEDLTSEIFALETGLSSDPDMNFFISDLDKFTLISNSDAHSPGKLGREANIFDCEMSFYEIKNALKNKDKNKFMGTYEFFPEEGKYHFDGHRKCNVCLSPMETLKNKGICPVCGKKLTLGVYYRIIELSNRTDIENIKKNSPPFKSIVPLTDILSEISKVGPNTKKVKSLYEKVIKNAGSEFDALWICEKETLDKIDIPLLSESIKRMRNRNLNINPGYDGEFGKVKIFDEKELDSYLSKGQVSFFKNIDKDTNIFEYKKNDDQFSQAKKLFNDKNNENIKKIEEKELNIEQLKAVSSKSKNIIVTAGPGTGKTTCLTNRFFHLCDKEKINPENIAAITFTIKAANEMKERIENKKYNKKPFTGTFHSFALSFEKDNNFNIIDETVKKYILKNLCKKYLEKTKLIEIYAFLSKIKQSPDFLTRNDYEFFEVINKYEKVKNQNNLIDYDDILLNFFKKTENEIFKELIKKKYSYFLIDEYQDLNEIQYEIIKRITDDSSSVFAIGDMDQSVYGFRGALTDFETRFSNDFKNVEKINLIKNYRSSETIIDASFQIIEKSESKNKRNKVYSGIKGEKFINIIVSDCEKLQAKFIADEIQNLVGGTDSLITYKKNFKDISSFSFSDIAVLCRTKKETSVISSVLEENFIPFSNINEKNLSEETGFKKLFSYMKLIFNELDISDLILKPFGIKTEINDIEENIKINEKIFNKLSILRNDLQNKKISEIINYLIKNTDLNKFENDYSFMDKINYIIKYSNNFNKLSEFLTSIKLMKISDIGIKGEKVRLMTLHASKGLEFEAVFIPNCFNGNIPFIKNGESKKEKSDEERRLFYVGLTRAKKRLYVLRPEKALIFGKNKKTIPSPFLNDLEDNILNEKTIKNIIKNSVKRDNQLKFF